MDKKIVYRLTFYKKGLLKYLGTNDLLSVINRALRRAEIPVRYSQGYNPRPIISLGFPCPVGVESYREYLDVELIENIEEETFKRNINKELPKDLQFYEVVKLEKKTSIIEDTLGINYEIHVFSHIYEILLRDIEEFQKLDNFRILVRRGSNIKEINLKDYVKEIKFTSEDKSVFVLYVNTLKKGNSIIRGEEILEIFSIKPYILKQKREVILNV